MALLGAEDSGDSGREATALRRRHRFYIQLLLICLLILGNFTLTTTGYGDVLAVSRPAQVSSLLSAASARPPWPWDWGC